MIRRFTLPMMACLACGHALGQETSLADRLSLHGMAMPTMVEERMPFEPSLRLYADARPAMRLGGTSALPERPPRIGLELKLAPSPARNLAHGTLLRTKLSEGTHLSLRVRRHGVGVVLRSEF